MQETIDYNFLIIGRSGAGKSATTKLLTGDPSITVANSLQQVTKDVHYYKGMKIQLPHQKNYIRFNVLDLPGLDRVDNRFAVRKKLLQELERHKISLNGIIYVSSLTERDTIDYNKLFRFIEQLPWPDYLRKNALIPILTKYDNLVIDSPEQQIAAIKQEYANVFTKAEYSTAWNKRVYWINHTKSLQFKMKIREQIREIYSKQILRLVQVAKKNKYLLDAELIKQYILQQEQYVGKKILNKISKLQIPSKSQKIQHLINLQIVVRPKKIFQEVTTLSASSIGIIISQYWKDKIPSSLCLFLSAIPITLSLINLTKQTKSMNDQIQYKKSTTMIKNQSRLQIISKIINLELEKQWQQFTQDLRFFLKQKFLYCQLNNNLNGLNYIFMEPQNLLQFRVNGELFQAIDESKKNFNDRNYQNKKLFRIEIPQFDQQNIWKPEIQVILPIKIFDEQTLLKYMENERIDFIKQPIKSKLQFEYIQH